MTTSTAVFDTQPISLLEEDRQPRVPLLPQVRPRVVILIEHLLVAEILRLALSEDEFDVVADVQQLDDAVRTVREMCPDVVILDVQSERCDGVALVGALRRAAPATAVVVLTSVADPDVVTAVMTAGASGYLTMDADMHDVSEALRGAAEGKVVLSGRRLEALVRHLSRRDSPPAAPRCGVDLTDRELEVLRLLVDGATTRGIATALRISPHTTRTHIQNVLTKLGVHSRLEAAAHAAAHGLV